MVTIEDIAREAGVSATTVSNVIHGRTNKVSAYTVDLINEIIRERGYVPNLSARAMKTRSSKVVALINHLESRDQEKFMSDPFFMDLTSAVEKALRERGYFLMIRAISESEDLLAFLRNWNVEGVFMPGLFEDEPFYQTLLGLKLPVVLTDSYVSALGHMTNIGLQDFEGGRVATEHLIRNGHKRIVFAGPKVKPGGVVEQRLLGYKQALTDNGIPFDPSLVYECEFSTTKMMELGGALAKREDITAVFATADILAAGIMSGLQQAGRMVPRDISIVGFDDINWARMTMPMLTTVHQDAVKKGRLAAECMIQLLEGETNQLQNRVLPVRLVERHSVRKI
ncbi:MAG: LacI family transcriptional regulator [Clostridiales bacterium]|nr:LacI family transcriptional regulator [Clostridiales bacterium]